MHWTAISPSTFFRMPPKQRSKTSFSPVCRTNQSYGHLTKNSKKNAFPLMGAAMLQNIHSTNQLADSENKLYLFLDG
jgi:hypothetical protein